MNLSKGCATTSDPREGTWAEVWEELVLSWFVGNCSESCSSRETRRWASEGLKGRLEWEWRDYPSHLQLLLFVSAALQMLMSPRTLSLAGSSQKWRLTGFQITESHSSWLERKDLLEGCSYLTGPKGCDWVSHISSNQKPSTTGLLLSYCFLRCLFLSPSLLTANQLLGFSGPCDWKHGCSPLLSHVPRSGTQRNT